ncbi:MAG: diheme cytochrome c [Deltaproteobacteria bacterium]|nr:diheme cytochrome c [Deltaproteobacteria bacterium]
MGIRYVFFAFLIAGGFAAAAGPAIAGDGEKLFPVVDNQVYAQECSLCHYLYQPGLLPERSWEKLMKESNDHFGENLGLDEKTASEILSYLKANCAEKTRNKRAKRILSSVGGAVPLRVTETPYMKGEHRRIKAEVFKRPSIQSFSNCAACHKTAAQGDFDEDNVSIPK